MAEQPFVRGFEHGRSGGRNAVNLFFGVGWKIVFMHLLEWTELERWIRELLQRIRCFKCTLLAQKYQIFAGGVHHQMEKICCCHLVYFWINCQRVIRHNCHPELKSVTDAIVGTAAEDPSMVPLQAKTHSSVGDKELKQVSSCITENILKRREQPIFLNEPSCKLNGYHRPIFLRKRSRTELRASVPNKQVHIRNDSPEVEYYPNNMPKSSEMISRERDILISGNRPNYMPKQSRYILGSRTDESLLKHPCWTLRAGVESWEWANMTGRCSEMVPDVSVEAVAKMFDGHRDYKQCTTKAQH